MKAFRSVTIIALSLFAVAAYAASDSVTAGTEPDQTTAQSSDAVGSPPTGMSQSGMRSGKTRAQVYQELERSQKDGTMDRLNSLYNGG